ncbi:hypothetical protein PO80_02480 [Vibrio parahaemolyticus]|uniref:DNA-binding response regulator n=1 Tax=Vibrio parahaemolyticus TaxID=670 RepID=UPI000543AC0F|nr:winged helix-turn-helix domain-containing protein [Vibrio parahaemolyticus]ELU8562248.1 response regulator transcription factor [Vibrio parahaemolyticus]KHF17364.1 hypothetical protein PO80_02480 [Vibrio parahaemolyticus]OTV96533.1 hypothetical protein BA739_23150 [Vibrio parahaemolyticus]OTW00264.1 hypothetical protein BA740_23825 [Vibrio parahaemolyticus]
MGTDIGQVERISKDKLYVIRPLVIIFGLDANNFFRYWNISEDAFLNRYRWLTIETAVKSNELQQADLIITDPVGIKLLLSDLSVQGVPVWVTDYKVDLDDVLFSLKSGALDCFPLSIDREILYAKLRRTFSAIGYGKRLSLKDYCICPISMMMFVGNRSIRLSVLEFKLSYLFFQYVNVTLSCNFIVEQVWGRAVEKERQYVNRIIYRLRRKIPKIPIKPARGGGYLLYHC